MKGIITLGLMTGLLCMSSAALADSAEPFQFAVVKGSPAITQTIVRINSSTGAGIICVSVACLPIGEAAAPSPGDYHLTSWATFDTQNANRTWDVLRFDARSGRIWQLNWDGKTANWSEFTYPQ